MANVWMLCAAGVSTSIFAKKVQDALGAQGCEVGVSAHSVAEAKEHGTDADLLLLTPQVQFERELIHVLFPEERIEAIPFEVFAAMDADAMAVRIRELLGA